MIRRFLLAGLAGLVLAASALAEAPRWRWQPGQVLVYRVEQNSVILDKVEDTEVQTRSRLGLRKLWRVLEVDAGGVATLQLTLEEITLETSTPDGETLRYSSADPEKSTPALRDQMGQYVGKVLAILRVGPQGQVLAVKESHFGPATRYENELPFAFILPEASPKAGETWTREYDITVTEKAPARQRYTCRAADDQKLVVGITTELREPPAAAADQVPWLQYLPEGEAVFDLQTGRLVRASLQVTREVKNHQAEGSVYKVENTYKEELVEAK